jgi:uncharacterized LabA/DUF88 family protein
VALFIDWDNLVISNYADRGANRPNIDVIVQKAQQYGTVVMARAYAEWTVMVDRLEVYKAGVEPIYAPVFHSERDLSGQMGKGKSLADPVMVTDCIDFLHLLPQVGTYVLVTGDKDMMPVVRLAKLRGRRVVVIGPDYVANVLQQICDEFVPYRLLLATAQPQVDPYAAAYYQQQGYYPQMPPGYYPPQVQQPQQTQTDNRRTRRLPGGRRGSSSQPYKDVTPPPPPTQPTMPQAPYGYTYGVPGTAPQPGYDASANYSAYGQPSYQGYPAQPTPQAYNYGTPTSPTAPAVAPGSYSQPTPQTGYGQQAQSGYVQPGQAQPQSFVQPQPAQTNYNQPVVTPVQAQPQPVQAQVVQPQPQAPARSPERAAQEKSSSSSNFEDVKEAIRAILSSRSTSGRGQIRARDLKEELLRRIPNFNERRYGYSKFKALLHACEQAGVLQLDQSGHILWVSLPGTPKTTVPAEFDEATLDAATPVSGYEEEDEDEDEDETEAETEAAVAELDAAVAAAEPQALEAAPETVEEAQLQTQVQAPVAEAEPEQPAFEAAIAAPETAERYTPTPAAEERVTTLAEAPYREKEREPRKQPEQLQAQTQVQPQSQPQQQPVRGAKAVERIPGLGARPSLLEQPFYEEVIVTIEGLRHRNRWLGYELLLSSVRDYLSKHMPESEAKSQAGSILSKLLNEGVLKMAMEVHSRGARKMRVQVAHLQEEHPAVRYSMGAAKYRAEQAAQQAQAVTEPQPVLVADEGGVPVVQEPQTEVQPSQAEAETQVQPEMTEPEYQAHAPEIRVQTDSAIATDEGQPHQEFATPDAQTFEAVAETLEQHHEHATLIADEGGVPVIQAEPEGETAQAQPEMTEPEYQAHASEIGDQIRVEQVEQPQPEKLEEAQPAEGDAPLFAEPALEGAPVPETEQPRPEGQEQPQPEEAQEQPAEGAETLNFGDQTQMEGETAQLPQEPEMSAQASGEEPVQQLVELPQIQVEPGDELQTQSGEGEGQIQPAEAEAEAEAGELGQEAQPAQTEQPHDPSVETAPEIQAAIEQPTGEGAPEHQQEQHGGDEQFGQGEQNHEQQHYEQQPSLVQHFGTPEQIAEHHEHHHEGGEPHEHHGHEHHHDHSEVSGEGVTVDMAETSGVSGETGEHVQGEPEQAPQGEEPAPAGGFINTVELEAGQQDGNHQGDGTETEANGTEEGHESGEHEGGHPPRRRRSRPAPEGHVETMAQPNEPRQAAHSPRARRSNSKHRNR